VKLHEQRALQTHRHAMFALDVPQINWRTNVTWGFWLERAKGIEPS
jgi:hypothetical protein